MSQVSWVRQLILALVLFSLGSVAYWWEFKKKPETEEREEQAKRAFQIKDTPVKALKLFNGNETYSFTCSDYSQKLCKPTDHSKWELSEPKKLKADDTNVNSLLSTLDHLNPTETFSLKDESPDKRAALLKEYGLDAEGRKKAKQVRLSTDRGDEVLYIGKLHPIGEALFALTEHTSGGAGIDETRVLLIPNFFNTNLEHDLTYWRDKKLSTLASHEIQAFQIQNAKSKFSGDRKEGQWIIHDGSADFPGDGELIDQLFSSLTTLAATGFVSDSKSDAKAKSALQGTGQLVSITLQKEAGASKEGTVPVTFTFYQKLGGPKGPDKGSTGKLYATVSNLDPLFEVDPSIKERIVKIPGDLRMKKLISTGERFATKHLEFSDKSLGPNPVILDQIDGKWRNASDKSEVPNEKIQVLLDNFTGNSIREFLPEKSTPKGEKDGLIVTLGDDKVKIRRQFIFWKKDKLFFGRDLFSNRKEAYVLDPTVQDVLPWNINFFKTPPGQEIAPHKGTGETSVKK